MSLTNSDRQIFRDLGVVQEGDFVLKSGEHSRHYFDLRRLTATPVLLNRLAHQLVDLFWRRLDPRVKPLICGVPHGALPLATLVSQITGFPLIMLRKTLKDHGTRQWVEGVYQESQPVILIDDVFTTGSSLREAEARLQENNLTVAFSVVLLNRSGRQLGDSILSLTTPEEWLAPPTRRASYSRRSAEVTDARSVTLLSYVLEKKSNLCFSADLRSFKEILTLFPKVAPYIVMMKLHLDILPDVTPEDLIFLREMADQYKVMLCEDRKLADIGQTNLRYLERWQMADWCDFVTCHANPGLESLELLGKFCSPILISGMSSNPDSRDEIRGHRTARLLKAGGVVSQEGGYQKPYLIFTPGIHLDKTQDLLGQRYQTPEEKLASGSDILIVGRGIYSAEDPEIAVQRYQRHCWKAYEHLTVDPVEKKTPDEESHYKLV